MLFEGRKDIVTEEECDDIISQLYNLIKGRNIEKELWIYCKDNHPEMIEAIKDFYSRLNKKDSHVCIEGETGSGKSTLTLCLMILMSYKLKKKLSLEGDVLFIPKESELSTRLRKLKEYELLWVDESIKSLNKMKYMNADAIDSNETVQTERFRHNTVFYCVPSFTELTKSFRDVNIKFRIWCIDGKSAFLRVKEIDPDIKEAFGAWHTSYRAKVKVDRKVSSESSISYRETIERMLPGHIRSFNWPDMENTPEFSECHLLYEVYKKRSRIIAEKNIIPKDEVAHTRTQKKQKMAIVHIMRKLLEEGKYTRFCDWWIENTDYAVFSEKTYLRYWQEAQDLIEKKRLDQCAKYLPTSNIVMPNPTKTTIN